MKDLSPLAVAHVPSTLAEPFSRTRILAPELLAQIFFLCRDDPDAARAPCNKHPSWVIITHVCARWRSVALSHACLWNTPRFTYNPQWIRAFVSRSRGAPLDISLTSSTLSSTSTISSWLGPLLAQHAHHIRALSLSGPPVPIHLLLTHLAGPGSRAPVLRNLHITASHTLFGDLPLTVPADLFGGHTPALEMLELRCTAVPAGFALVRCRSLKTLHVELPPVGLGERKGAPFVSGEDMVRALEGMNGLERLKLVNCLPRIESGAEDDDGILERLRKIVKEGFLDKESKKALSIGLGGVLLR